MIIVTIVVTEIKAFFSYGDKKFLCDGKPSWPTAVLRREGAAWFVHVHLVKDVVICLCFCSCGQILYAATGCNVFCVFVFRFRFYILVLFFLYL